MTDGHGNLNSASDRRINREATRLSYYRARYYDQSTGKFLSEDPARFLGGYNFYRYSVNNPINFNDPFGLCPPTLNQRIALGLKGLANLGIGIAKVAGGSAATAGTGGLAVGLGAYELGSGLVGNIGGGMVQIIGAATGNVEGAEQTSDTLAAVSSATGLVTLFATKGNICAAAKAAQVEGIALTPFTVGLGPTAGGASEVTPRSIFDGGMNFRDLVTGKGCAPPSGTSCSSQGCPK